MITTASRNAVMGWGLRIDSPISIPGTVPVPGPATGADVAVTMGPCCDPEPWPAIYAWDGVALEFAPPGVARFQITSAEIIIRPHPSANEVAVIGLLIATAFPALLWLRKFFVLHAAGLALRDDGCCVAIAGESGAGKSTLALWLMQQGGQLIGDDTLAIDISDKIPRCHGLPGGVFQGAGSERHFRAVTPVPDAPAEPGILSAMVVLKAGEELALRRLSGVRALQAAMQNCHRLRVPQLTGRQQLAIDMANAICRATPLYELRFDKQKHALQDLGRLIIHVCSNDWGTHEPISTE